VTLIAESRDRRGIAVCFMHGSCGEGECSRHAIDTAAQGSTPRTLLRLRAADGGARKLISCDTRAVTYPKLDLLRGELGAWLLATAPQRGIPVGVDVHARHTAAVGGLSVNVYATMVRRVRMIYIKCSFPATNHLSSLRRAQAYARPGGRARR
jgi:hypothetical protein